MKLAVLSSLDFRLTRKGLLESNSRLSGPHRICNLATEIGYDATAIDYFNHWDQDELVDALVSWFGDDPRIIIGTSGSVNDGNTELFKNVCLKIKLRLPHLKVILGGYRIITGEASWIDASFIGRCANIVKDYLLQKDISRYLIANNPPSYKNPLGVISEDPVAPILCESDFCSDKEIITIETGLGCKFNCAFCGFDYRNNRRPVVNNLNNLIKSCQTAYDVSGMTDFFLADDTINEVDSKLELLAELSTKLSFKPRFMAFARLDVIGAKPHQIDLFKRANIDTLFFGIESLNPSVTKMIRKGGKPEKNYDVLRRLKKEYAEAFTYGNFIIGLTGDSEKDIWDHSRRIVDEQLLTSAGCNPLRIYSKIDNPESQSEIDKNPKKYGYTLIDGGEYAGQAYQADLWVNEWTSYEESTVISNKLDMFLSENLRSAFTAHEYFSIRSTIPGLAVEEYNKLLPLVNVRQVKNIKRYIAQKLNWLKSY